LSHSGFVESSKRVNVALSVINPPSEFESFSV
jgi:hypothetical protein